MSKKIKIQITSWLNGSVLFEYESVDNTIKKTVEEAVKRSADLRYADLGSADLGSADLRSANLGYANLRYADLGSADLGYANLRSANLRSADLRSANLGYANLRYADLRYADLGSADLRSANLRSADLRSANLRYADLRYADLGSADLRSADLRSANLRSADLGYAKNLNSNATDFWWHIHHEILVEQLNEPVRARINYIKKEKPKAEVELRLKLLHPVLGKIPSTQKGWEALHKKECGCSWDGRTIFTKANGLEKDVT